MKTYTPYDILTRRFDAVAVLTLAEAAERQGFMKWQNERLDRLWNPSMLQMNVAVRHPFGKELAKLFGMNRENEYSCAREHYAIVKRAYQQGAESLLVMEDDICLLKDMGAWSACLAKIPNGWDILSFNGFSVDPVFAQRTATLSEARESGKWWVRRSGTGLWNAAMYALSRRGMEFYMRCQEQKMSVADMPIYVAGYNEDMVDAFYAACPMAVQEDKDVLPSYIRDKSNDGIDYARMNAYESKADKNDYFKYDDYYATIKNDSRNAQ